MATVALSDIHNAASQADVAARGRFIRLGAKIVHTIEAQRNRAESAEDFAKLAVLEQQALTIFRAVHPTADEYADEEISRAWQITDDDAHAQYEPDSHGNYKSGEAA